MASVVIKDLGYRFLTQSDKVRSLREAAGRNGDELQELYGGLNCTLADGDRVGIAGPNGSGKTTLLRLIAGILTPTRGSIEVDGKVNSLINISLGTNDELSGYDNIFLRGMFMNFSHADIQPLVEEIVEFAELERVIDQPLRTYSSGMKLRLAFSIATALPCEILLLDEWLSAGDKNFRDKAADKMKEFVDKASIVVVASNNRATLERNTNNIIELTG